MKKLLLSITKTHNLASLRQLAITASALFTISTSAQGVDDMMKPEKWHGDGNSPVYFGNKIHFNEGQPIKQEMDLSVGGSGIYDIAVVCNTNSVASKCKIYAKGTDYTVCSAEVPLAKNQQEVKVYLRGVGTTDGKITIGIESDGMHSIEIGKTEVKKTDKPYKFLQGGDITMLHYTLDRGGNYFDVDGKMLYNQNDTREEKAQAVLDYMSRRGFNFVRIRNSNNPGPQSTDASGKYCFIEGYQDTEDCLRLAREAHKAGMEIQYTFNLSDYWSNGECQRIPRDWEEKIKNIWSFDEKVNTLVNLVGDYVKTVMQEMADEGIYPAYVSVGNEINAGFLFPYAYSYDVPANEAKAEMPTGEKHPENIAKIINAAYNSIKSVSPNSKVVVHLADATSDVDKWGSPSTYKWYFDLITKAGAKFDVIGASYYPSWSETTAESFAKSCEMLFSNYGKDVLIMESGYNFTPKRKDGYDGQLSNNAPAYSDVYKFSQEGQKGFIAELINTAKGVGYEDKGSNEIVGSLYWDPMMIHVEDQWGNNMTGWAHFTNNLKADVNVVENTTLFDFDGKAVEAWQAYEGNQYSEYKEDEETHVELHESDPERRRTDIRYDILGRRCKSNNGIYIEDGKKKVSGF